MVPQSCLVAVAEVPDFEDIEFAEVLPGGIVHLEDLDYSYDDMSKHYNISITASFF